MLLKNEADIIAYTLREASKWADHIYIYDHTSTDGSWEIVQSMANEKIIPWRQHQKVYSEGLKADVFNEFRHTSQEGDWWMKFDADDFYGPELRTQLAAVPQRHNLVWTITLDYEITDKDLKELNFERGVEEILPRLRYFRPAYSEPHLFRYRKGLTWTDATAWPRHCGLTAYARPLLRHYPHRSPKQIQSRLDIRREQRAKGFTGWQHASQNNWQEKVVDHTLCMFDDRSGNVTIDESKLPRHIEPLPIRLAKSVLHGSGVWP